MSAPCKAKRQYIVYDTWRKCKLSIDELAGKHSLHTVEVCTLCFCYWSALICTRIRGCCASNKSTQATLPSIMSNSDAEATACAELFLQSGRGVIFRWSKRHLHLIPHELFIPRAIRCIADIYSAWQQKTWYHSADRYNHKDNNEHSKWMLRTLLVL